MNAYDLAGKYAIVTGGAGGIGLAVGRMLRDCGAAVSLWDVSATVHEVTGLRMQGRQVDVTDAAQVAAAAKADAGLFGRVDVLVNNAGRAWMAARHTSADARPGRDAAARPYRQCVFGQWQGGQGRIGRLQRVQGRTYRPHQGDGKGGRRGCDSGQLHYPGCGADRIFK